ncbi:MAG: hypothetical protein LBJ00_02750 [Planctomycetaceae bacterium]|nr:hypothetical protein [Planctomycetaceae bacterium]
MFRKITFVQFVIFAVIFSTTDRANAEQKYPLVVKILNSDGRAFQDQSNGVVLYAQLWQKIAHDSAVQGTYRNPVVHSSDGSVYGSVWRQISSFSIYPQNSTVSDWILNHEVAVGEYRVTFTVWKRSPQQVADDSIKIIGRGDSEPIFFDDSKASKELEVRADTGSKVQIRTKFLPDPNEESKKDDKNSTPQKITEANAIKMRIFNRLV